jgi:hypothetical protein
MKFSICTCSEAPLPSPSISSKSLTVTAKKSDKSVPAPAGTVIILFQERTKKKNLYSHCSILYVLKAKLVQQAVSALSIWGGGGLPWMHELIHEN